MPSASRGAETGGQSTSSAPATPPVGANRAGAESDDTGIAGTATPSPQPPQTDETATGSTAGPQPAQSGGSGPSPSPPPPPAPVQRPGLLSRLSFPLHLPLRNRNRNVADFHIRPDEPHKKYTAGEHVHGAVVLAVLKPLRITHLTVSLHGFVRVRREPTSTSRNRSQGSLILPQGSSDTPQYHGHGFASLFQDEQVLSGEGRLDQGRYEFHFDLMFPDKSLPSSIDFERGTISYLITAILTRPTTIAPTSTCDRKVVFVQQVDIGTLRPPRPRTIFLEPISKRMKKKRTNTSSLEKASTTQSDNNDIGSEAGSVDPSVATEDSGRERPIDLRSEISGESSRSVSTAISRAEFAQLSQIGTPLSSPAKQQVVDQKTITASIELIKGGCLPGDTVTVRIRVQHIKRLKSMTGVVVTLFRQGKIDSSPSQAMFDDRLSKDDARRAQKDDAYPRSRAGLVGLSLSSTSSVSMFRKDLDQNAAPLIIDPATLQASVTVAVKLPDDSFPTIRDVPGQMIGFKYQLEVIIDLGGRLSSQFQGAGSARFGGGDSESNKIYGPRRGAEIADTAALRREKGVISVSMETVVGTTDTSRGVKKGQVLSSRMYRMTESDDDDVIRPELGYLDEAQYGTPSANGYLPNGYFPPQPPANDARYSPIHPPLSLPPGLQPPPGPWPPDTTHVNGYVGEASPTYVPPPHVPDQGSLTEKERVRQAEMRLLPSQPPENDSSGAGPSGAGPSAPPATEDNIYDADETPRADVPMSAEDGPSAPTEEVISSGANAEAAVEDKQERERRRLIDEASAPPEFPEDMDPRRRGGTDRRDMAPDATPSAPVLDEDDSYDSYRAEAGPSSSSSGRNRDAEQLPAYER